MPVIIGKKNNRLTFVMCWLVYFFSYTGRLNFSAALAGIVTDGIFTKSQGGLIGSAFFFCYAVGQLLNGMAGDRISPFKMISAGLALTAVSNLCMVLFPHYLALVLCWGINGFAQSMLWSPILLIFAQYMEEPYRYGACLHIATSPPVGTLFAYLLSMVCLHFGSWRIIFLSSGAVLVLTFLGWLFFVRWLHPSRPAAAPSFPGAPPQRKVGLLGLLLASGTLFLILPTILHGMLKDGVLTWVPTMITERFSVPPAFSVFQTMLLPLISISGAYLCPYLNRKWFHNEVATVLFFFALGAFSIVLLLLFPGAGIGLYLLLLAVIVSSMHAVNTMLVTFVPVHFTALNKTAALTGILNFSTYLGCALSNYGFGWLAERTGWQATILVWLFLCAAALISCALLVQKWSRFLQEKRTL